jgi:hypothetical protein
MIRALLELIVLAACVAAIAIWASRPAAAESMSDQQMFALAKKAVSTQLKDPMSAQFGQMVRNADSVCGTINAKNGFGGYVGSAPFVFSIENKRALIGYAGMQIDPKELCK